MNELTERKPYSIAVGIFFLALIIRLVYLYQVSKNPDFFIPLVDSGAYDTAASTFVSTGTMEKQFFWQAFFYPMLLSIIYAFAGHSIVTVIIMQTVLGSVICVLVYYLGMKIFNRKSAILAATAIAFYGPLIYFGAELLATVWASFWALILIFLFLIVVNRNNLWLYFVLGICGGLSIITRATFIPFFAFTCLWLASSMRRRSMKWKPILLAETMILIGVLFIVIPVSIQCYRVTGLFSPLPESGPINLYIGNNSDLPGIRAMRPGEEWDEILLMPIREGYRTRLELVGILLACATSADNTRYQAMGQNGCSLHQSRARLHARPDLTRPWLWQW